eukprot:9469594-Pyramimonas_sp.AAC.1
MSAGDSPGAGGLAFLIPWFSEAELATMDPQMLPSLSLDPVIDGRVAVLTISNSTNNEHIKIMNVHNHELPTAKLPLVRRRWLDGAAWAQSDERHRIFIAIGDFNIADIEPVHLSSPRAASASAPTRGAGRRRTSATSSSSSSST